MSHGPALLSALVVAALSGTGCGPKAEAAKENAATSAQPAPEGASALAEVEMAGRVQWPREAGAEPTVYIEDGPCFESGSRAFSHVLVGPSGDFNHEVFVPQRTKLWLCGSVLGPSGKIEYAGTATGMPFLAEGQGEVIIPRTEITLTRAAKPIDIPQAR